MAVLDTHACYRQKWGTKKSARRWSFRRYVITGLGDFPLGVGEIDCLGKCSKKIMIPSDLLLLQYFHAAPSASSSTAYTTMDSEGSDDDE